MTSLAEDEPETLGSVYEQSRVPFFRTTREYLSGIGLLLVVVILWTSSNFVTQNLFADGYHKPFLVTYLNTSSFTFYLIPFLIRNGWARWRRTSNDLQAGRGQYEVLPATAEHADNNSLHYSGRVTPIPNGTPRDDVTDLPPLTTIETARLASTFCFFWFIANWSVNVSLDYTSVASSTILSSTSGFFTLAIGRLFAVETLTPIKVGAVVTSFVGVLLVSLSDSSPKKLNNSVKTLPANTHTNPALGDIFAILAAIFYAVYVILLKIRIRSESRIDMQLFFGFVGAVNTVALVPVGLVLHFSRFEPFALPTNRKAWSAVLFNMLITLSSDYIYVIAMLKTTPLVVTIGLSLTIPFAIVGDEILNIPTKTQAALGALLVLGSFGMVGWENAEISPQKNPQDDVSIIGQGRREGTEIE
ncbi:hypothetical protein K439DRAFT_1418863 [Ramaria rubella]|nr:hypothetical protein K439DRAFT_1418863 [Ramaria rubella]